MRFQPILKQAQLGFSVHSVQIEAFFKTEHEKFSVDAGSSPAGVLGHHLEDQIPNFFGCLSSTDGLSDLRNRPPVPTEPGAVPSDDGFGRDDEECLFPA